MEEIREEACSPIGEVRIVKGIGYENISIQKKGDTVSQVSFDQLNRNDSKVSSLWTLFLSLSYLFYSILFQVNMFKENEDSDTNQPALGKGINLEEKIT